jgi:predicted amidophosphoribosyltransferase
MAETLVCSVCSEDVTEESEAWCNSCGKPYHLSQRVDVPGKDCGKVWINEDHLALEFACDTCLQPASPVLDDVLDLDEAATAAGVNADWLQAEAEAGRVPHRRTSGGVLLFARGDLPGTQRNDG